MNILKLLFSFKGSISRVEYLAGFGIGLLIGAILLLLNSIINTHDDHSNLSNILKLLKAATYLSTMFMIVIAQLALASKRLRNIQWSQWLLLLFPVPFVHLGLLMAFLFVPGKVMTRAVP
jgi:uncharacterized membrane protein YhaH (DUF805 family)